MAILDATFALIVGVGRSIGGIIPDVVVEEVHRDTLMITDHPVETGAAISDHAFMMPVEIEMRVGWSDSSSGYIGAARDAYEMLQALQQSRTPFTVITGKRVYSNMLIRGLQAQTDVHSENILQCTCNMREVIIVSTQTTSSKVGAQSAQATPAKTAATNKIGTKQLGIPHPAGGAFTD